MAVAQTLSLTHDLGSTAPGVPGAAADAGATGRLSWVLAAVVTVLAAVVPAVLWPGEVSWMNDEPLLVAHAYHFNQDHVLAYRGLAGSFPVPYGPMPTQFYQLVLHFTLDPVKIVLVRAALCSAVTALSLLWLARTLKLTPWFAAAVVLAPFLWMFDRLLWDASFAVPVGTLALAAYASFLKTRSGRSLVVAVACTLVVPLIHLQGLPLLAAIGGHLWWRERPALRKHRAGVLAAAGVVAALNATYFYAAFVAFFENIFGILLGGHGSKPPPGMAMLSAFMGGRLLSGNRFVDWMEPHLGPPALVRAATVASMAAVPLVWLGVAVAVRAELRRRREIAEIARREAAGEHPPAPAPSAPSAAATRDLVVRIALAALGFQVALYTVMRIPPSPQYFFGTFPVHVLFAWIGVEALHRFRLRGAVTALWGVSLAFITLGTMTQVHSGGWDRGCMSPSLENQIEVARALDRYADASVLTDVSTYQTFPHALRALRLVLPHDPAAAATPRESGRLVVRYVPDPDGNSSRIELIEARSDADVPKDAKRIDVTPMARWY